MAGSAAPPKKYVAPRPFFASVLFEPGGNTMRFLSGHQLIDAEVLKQLNY
jgi:hypothetical protein